MEAQELGESGPETTAYMTLMSLISNGPGSTLYAADEEGLDEFMKEFCDEDAGMFQSVVNAAVAHVTPPKKSPLSSIDSDVSLMPGDSTVATGDNG